MGKCEFQLTDGKPCGLEAGQNASRLCAFHHHTHSEGSAILHSNEVRGYIQQNRRDYLDISKVAMRKVAFDNSFFSTDTKVVFQRTRFYDCTFDGCDFFDADFTWCTFENCQFRNCTFRGTTCSFKVRLLEGSKTPFVGCFFDLERDKQSEVDFSGCKIRLNGCLFDACDVSASKFFMSFADIRASRLNIILQDPDGGRAPEEYLGLNGVEIVALDQLRLTGDFIYRQFQGNPSLEPQLYFRAVDFSKMRSARFIRANLKKASLKDAVVDGVVFTDPMWPRSGGRKYVWDDEELTHNDAPGLRQLMELYVRLKKNYESSRNYIDASDWFYREMECRRRLIAVKRDRVVRWLRQNIFSFTPLYRYISSYGENYTRPLWWIAGVLIVFAVAYFYTGYPSGVDTIVHEFGWEDTVGAAGDFVDALAFSAGVMLLQFTRVAAEQPSPTPVLAVVQVVLTLILVPLFLLALRRKFRR